MHVTLQLSITCWTKRELLCIVIFTTQDATALCLGHVPEARLEVVIWNLNMFSPSKQRPEEQLGWERLPHRILHNPPVAGEGDCERELSKVLVKWQPSPRGVMLTSPRTS